MPQRASVQESGVTTPLPGFAEAGWPQDPSIKTDAAPLRAAAWIESLTQAAGKGAEMKIGILGAGRIGATAARLFVAAGNQVAICNSRGPESLQALAAELGPQARAATLGEAAAFGEAVLLAVPWHRADALPPSNLVRGKIVIDAMNPYKPEGGFYDLGNSTSSEEVLKHLPEARLVKAFNTIYYEHLATRGRKDLPVEERHAIYLASDDLPAKEEGASLTEPPGLGREERVPLGKGAPLHQPDPPISNQPSPAREPRPFSATSCTSSLTSFLTAPSR